MAAEESYSSEVIDFRSPLTKPARQEPRRPLGDRSKRDVGGYRHQAGARAGLRRPSILGSRAHGVQCARNSRRRRHRLKAVVPNPDLSTNVGKELLANFKARYGIVAPWPWFQGSAYDGVYIAAECLSRTNDDQDAEGFRDCLYDLTWSGAIGDDYSFDENGDVVGVSHVLIEVLPVAERTDENLGYRIVGPPPAP